MRIKTFRIVILSVVIICIMPFGIKAADHCCEFNGGMCGCRCCDGALLSEKCATLHLCNYEYYPPGPYVPRKNFDAMHEPIFYRVVNIRIDGIELPVKGIAGQGRTVVPVRGVFENMNAKVDYIPDTRQIFVYSRYGTLVFTLNDKYVQIGRKKFLLDAPAQIINGRAYVPLRFVAQYLGAKVGWDPVSGTAIIQTQKEQRYIPTTYR